MTVRKEVRWFAERMEEKLAKNDHKGHWSNCTMQYLEKRLGDEKGELSRRLKTLAEVPSGEQPSADLILQVTREAADVANFAMMIADNMRQYGKQVTVFVYGTPVQLQVYPERTVYEVAANGLALAGYKDNAREMQIFDAYGDRLELSETCETVEFPISVAPPAGHGG